MMSIESNVVSSEEVEFLYPFDMSKEEDVVTVFDAFVKEYFLRLEEEKQHQVLEVIEDVLQAGDKVVEYFLNTNLVLLQKSQEIKLLFWD